MKKNPPKLRSQSFDIIAKTAHELRSPLVAIAGYLSLIEERGEKLDVEMKKYLFRASDSARKSLLLIDCLLDIDSVSRRDAKPSLAPIRPDSILKLLYKELAENMAHAGLSVEQDRAYRLPLILASRPQLLTILRHVFSYQIDYAKRGQIKIHFRSREGKLIIKFTSNGILPAATEIGSTVPLSARDIELYIAQYLLRLSGGELAIRAFPKTQTTIYLYLPLARQLKLSV